jgi:hypothetical protein
LATAAMIRSHQAAAIKSTVRSRQAPASCKAAISASIRGMGTDVNGDDPSSHARIAMAVTPQAAANVAWLARADRRAERSTAPATEPTPVVV